eukprot:EG_transcript_34557
MVVRLDGWRQLLAGALCLITACFVLQKSATRETQLHTIERGLRSAPQGVPPAVGEQPAGEAAVYPFVVEYRRLFHDMMVKNSIPKRFVLYDPPLHLRIGWGNRFLSLCFLFMYCLLTQRVLLLSERSCMDVAELFCPPSGVVWSFERVAPMFRGERNISGWWFIDDRRAAGKPR